MLRTGLCGCATGSRQTVTSCCGVGGSGRQSRTGIGHIETPAFCCWGRGKRPVIRVNGKDAVTYAEWLSRKTGKMQLHRFITAHDVGTTMNPITHQGQIDGGVIMGLGQAVMQELVMKSGQVTNANLGDYKLLTAADIPKLKTVLVRSGGGLAPFEAKAIGEFANNSPPAAVANALADAVGAGIFELPITAEKIYHALKGKTRQ